jgi:hypothetical protein
MELVNACKPDLWASLPDEVPNWVAEKRNRLSVDRTLQWLDHCLSLQPVCRFSPPGSFQWKSTHLFFFSPLSILGLCYRNLSVSACNIGMLTHVKVQNITVYLFSNFGLQAVALGRTWKQVPRCGGRICQSWGKNPVCRTNGHSQCSGYYSADLPLWMFLIVTRVGISFWKSSTCLPTVHDQSRASQRIFLRYAALHA